jgi:hypothetical protein
MESIATAKWRRVFPEFKRFKTRPMVVHPTAVYDEGKAGGKLYTLLINGK